MVETSTMMLLRPPVVSRALVRTTLGGSNGALTVLMRLPLVSRGVLALSNGSPPVVL